MVLDLNLLLQLSGVLLGAVLVFCVAYWGKPKTIMILVICSLPFQPIESGSFGSANIAVLLLIFMALMFRGYIRSLPLWGGILLIFLTYMVSFSLSHPATQKAHFAYMLALISAYCVFYIAYNMTRYYCTAETIIGILVVQNVLIAIYCIIQLIYGDASFVPFGIQEFKWIHGRGGSEPRMTGPFRASGITAEYLLICIVLLVHLITSKEARENKQLLGLLLFVDLGLLVSTGNRTALILLFILVLPFFLYRYRNQISFAQFLGLFSGLAIAFVAASYIMINYTSYGVIFDRLQNTEIEEGVPDTRAETWPMAINAIKNKPVVGHGPRLRLPKDTEQKIEGHDPIYYPHNIILHLLYTVGVVGLIAYILFFLSLLKSLKLKPGRDQQNYLYSVATLGIPFVLLIIIDQMKVEFLRFALVDYWHVVFAILGVWLAFVHRYNFDLVNNNERIAS